MNIGSKTTTFFLASLLGFCLFAPLGCTQAKKSGTPPIAKPDVVVDAVQQDDVQLYIYVTGRTEPYKFVDVTARVTGYLQELYFKSGSIVEKDDKLAQIEREQYQIALDSAEAELEVNKAREALAKSNLDRAQQLVESKTITTEEYQSKLAEHKIMLATVERGKTAVNKAKLDLSYTELTAPIPGKTTQNKVDVGNLVGPGAQMSILTIAQMDPLYVDFELSDKQFTDLKDRMGLQRFYQEALAQLGDSDKISKSGKASKAGSSPAKPAAAETKDAAPLLPTTNGGPKPIFDFSLMTGADTLSVDFPYQGEIVAVIDNEIRYETGQIMLRGEIRNPLLRDKTSADYMLYPGQICRVRIPYEKLTGAVLIREEAIQTDLDTKYVLVIKEGDYTPKNPFGVALKDENGKDLVDHGHVVHRRDIKIGKLLDTQQRIVLEGLDPGEKYVVLGTQKARIGSAVTPIDFKLYRDQRSKEFVETKETTEAQVVEEKVEEKKEQGKPAEPEAKIEPVKPEAATEVPAEKE